MKFHEEEEEEDMLTDEQMVEIAENTLVKIAEALINSKASLRQIYQKSIIVEELQDGSIELLTPFHFLEGLKTLPNLEFTEIEVACLMNVLAKP